MREPTQSKRMSRFHKSQFKRKLTEKMLRPKLSPEPGHTFCASLHGRNACQNFTSNFIQKFTGKMPQPKTTAQTLCEPAQSKRVSRFHKGHLFTRKFTGKMPQPKTTAQTLCEPAQSKRVSRFHKSHLFTRKAAAQNHGPHFVRACAVETHIKISLRATLYGN